MAAPCAVLVFALDHATLGLLARLRVALDAHRKRTDLALDCFVALILEPESFKPVDADDVRPHFLLSVFAKRDGLDHSVNFGAEDALNLRALLLRLCKQVTASGAVPVSFGDAPEQLAAITNLVHSHEAKIAENDLIVVVIFVVKTNVAYNILVELVLVKPDLLVRVVWIDLVVIGFQSFILIDLHSLRLL